MTMRGRLAQLEGKAISSWTCPPSYAGAVSPRVEPASPRSGDGRATTRTTTPRLRQDVGHGYAASKLSCTSKPCRPPHDHDQRTRTQARTPAQLPLRRASSFDQQGGGRARRQPADGDRAHPAPRGGLRTTAVHARAERRRADARRRGASAHDPAVARAARPPDVRRDADGVAHRPRGASGSLVDARPAGPQAAVRRERLHPHPARYGRAAARTARGSHAGHVHRDARDPQRDDGDHVRAAVRRGVRARRRSGMARAHPGEARARRQPGRRSSSRPSRRLRAPRSSRSTRR